MEEIICFKFYYKLYVLSTNILNNTNSKNKNNKKSSVIQN